MIRIVISLDQDDERWLDERAAAEGTCDGYGIIEATRSTDGFPAVPPRS